MAVRSHWKFRTNTMTIGSPTPGRQGRFGGRAFGGIAGQRRPGSLVRDLGIESMSFRPAPFPIVTLAQMKMQFFDRQMFGAYDAAEKRVLNRTGAVARLTVRRSMKWIKGRMRRYKKGHPLAGQSRRVFKPSTPPTPPRARRGYGQLRTMTNYWISENKQSVIIGPAYLHSSNRYFRSTKTKPQLHEEGGIASLYVLGRTGFGSVTESTRYWVQATYPPRPYIKPAYEKTLPKFRRWWKDSMQPKGLGVTVQVSSRISNI